MDAECGPPSTQGQTTPRKFSKNWFMWDLGYNELMMNFNAPTRQSHGLYHILCTIYRIVHHLIYFPQSVCVRSSSFLRSFVPSITSKWHSLPTNITNALTVSVFKSHLVKCNQGASGP